MNAPMTAASQRQPWLDVLRGLAMVWMTVFHFGFDLNHFGYWRQDFLSDPFWLTQRTLIVSLFLCCAGWGQALAGTDREGMARFWRRWAQIALCALAVSIGSWLMFAESYISFGVLHGMAAMLLVLRLAGVSGVIHRTGTLVTLSAVCIVLPWWLPPWLPNDWAVLLNGRALNGLGLVTVKPFTQDYVPVLPWLGVMLSGYGLGRWLLRSRVCLPGPPSQLAPLAALGRWPLSYYMLHQPVMIGGLLAYRALLPA